MKNHLLKKREDKEALGIIVNLILRCACRQEASQVLFDPHDEANPDIFLVNFKVKEEVQLWLGSPKWLLSEIVSHLRAMARMKTLDEQGVIQVRLRDKKHALEINYNLQVEIALTPHGEQVTLTFVDEEILN